MTTLNTKFRVSLLDTTATVDHIPQQNALTAGEAIYKMVFEQEEKKWRKDKNRLIKLANTRVGATQPNAADSTDIACGPPKLCQRFPKRLSTRFGSNPLLKQDAHIKVLRIETF
jgi:hypothetical protein